MDRMGLRFGLIVLVAIALTAVACGDASRSEAGGPAGDLAVPAVTQVSAIVIPGEEPGSPVPFVDATGTEPGPVGSLGITTDPASAIAAATAAPSTLPVETRLTIASGQLPIPGTRAYIDGQMEIDGVPEPSDGGVRTLTLRLHNPEFGPTGVRQSRGVISFGKWIVDGEQLDSYIDVPTEEGTLRLHLHRDGTLRLTEDDGPYF